MERKRSQNEYYPNISLSYSENPEKYAYEVIGIEKTLDSAPPTLRSNRDLQNSSHGNIKSPGFDWKQAENIKKLNGKKAQAKQSDLESTAKILTRHVDTKKLANNSSLLKLIALFSVARSEKVLRNVECRDCTGIEIIFKLSCTHETCYSCAKEKITNYINNPSPSSFKLASCQTCKKNYSEIDFKKILGATSPLYEIFVGISFTKKCCRCEFSLILHIGYFAESNCLHLCLNCYCDDIFMGFDACTCCNKKYLHDDETRKRKTFCSGCGKIGEIVGQCYRISQCQHVMCVQCMTSSSVQKKCKVCLAEFSKKEIKHLGTIINKRCSACKKKFPLVEMDYSQTCCKYLRCKGCALSQCPYCSINT